MNILSKKRIFILWIFINILPLELHEREFSDGDGGKTAIPSVFRDTVMDKEEILQRIKESAGDTGLSDRTLADYVDNNMPEAGKDPDDAYFTRHAAVLKSIAGNFRHDVASAVEDFKKNWKPDPKPAPKPDPDGSGEDLKKSLAEWQKRVEGMEARLAEADRQASRLSLEKGVREAMRGKGASDEYVLGKVLDSADFGGETDAAKIAESLLSAYDAEYTACRGHGTAPRFNAGGGGGGGSKDIDDFFSRKAKRESWAKRN